jgi:hypothetical protein
VVRRYDDPVEVWPAAVGADRPGQFRWRGRRYVVRGVLAHWVEAGAWWRPRGADGLPVRIDDAGRHLWRVEADTGRSATPGVYDLAYDEAGGSWTLARALD